MSDLLPQGGLGEAPDAADGSAVGPRARPGPSTLCRQSPTGCPVRTRLYRQGRACLDGFPLVDISGHLQEADAVLWVDLHDPDPHDLALLSEEFGLHHLAVQDAANEQQRPKLDRYPGYLFLNAYATHLDPVQGTLVTSEVAAFITERALITVRKDDGLDIDAIVQRWDESPDLARHGVSYLLYGFLDYVVDGHFAAVQSLDDAIESLEDQLFAEKPADREVQRHSFELRKSLVLLRRVVLPMREVVNALLRRDLHVVEEPMQPYYQDVYDHVLRATEWTESLRDLVATILETNLTIQGNRMNVISKKVTSWAAIIAVPTLITGFAGMNLPYPGFARPWGLAYMVGAMVAASAVLYAVFRAKDWL